MENSLTLHSDSPSSDMHGKTSARQYSSRCDVFLEVLQHSGSQGHHAAGGPQQEVNDEEKHLHYWDMEVLPKQWE